MSRPSRNTDQKLIEAAIAMLPETGYSRLSMRAVAKKAGVNLGMFHYHFKNKETFLAQVAEEFYGRFFKTFTLEVAAGKDPEKQLANAILSVVRFARDNRGFMLAMIRDVLDGNQQLVRLLEEFIPKHSAVILRLIQENQKKKNIADMPIPMVITFILGSMAGPIMIAAVLEQLKLRPPYQFFKKVAVPYILSDPIIKKRLSLVMRGLDPRQEKIAVDPAWKKEVDDFVGMLTNVKPKKKTPQPGKTEKQKRRSKA